MRRRKRKGERRDKRNAFILFHNLLIRSSFSPFPFIEAASLGPRSAFAFVRFIDPSASAAAIEAENGAEWLGRRIRVQYCESSEMKTKRRLTKCNRPSISLHPPFPLLLSLSLSLSSTLFHIFTANLLSYNYVMYPPLSLLNLD